MSTPRPPSPDPSATGVLLAVRDADGLVAGCEAALTERGFELHPVDTVTDGAHRLREGGIEAAVIGVGTGTRAARALILRFIRDHPRLPVVLLVPADEPELLARTAQTGAFAVLPAPLDQAAVALMCTRAVGHRRLRRRVARLEHAMRDAMGFDELIGGSPTMQELYALIDRAARSQAPVAITGESGTGKEVVAEALHRRSGRTGPFLPVNVAALPEALLESELFGHEKGAFTDARSARKGLFLQAHGGTLFLDEIGELPLGLQPKLLRALQARRVRPVGSDRELPFDARIVTATNRDLDEMVQEGRFREDLYYRLCVIQLEVPPLRERGSDVLLLARHFLERIASRAGKDVRGVSNEAAELMVDYRWPGNVRELYNCMERAVALTQEHEVQPEDLPRRLRPAPAAALQEPVPEVVELEPMHVVEARHIRRVMEATGGNRSQAARVLGFDRKTLLRKLKRYDLEDAGRNGVD